MKPHIQAECLNVECGVCHICQEPHKTSEHPKECVYQLRAKGESLMGFAADNFSKTVFATEELAMAKIPVFRALLVDRDRPFAMADNESLKIQIVPLEIIREGR